jgi:hypothetical protein
MAGAEREQLQPLGSGLEATGDAGGDPDRVERCDVDDLIVELQPPGSGEHDVDLLGLVVAVPERLAAVGLEPVVAEAGALGGEVVVGEPGLADLREAELDGGVVDPLEVLERVWRADDGEMMTAWRRPR